jgi:hypothetical protein
MASTPEKKDVEVSTENTSPTVAETGVQISVDEEKPVETVTTNHVTADNKNDNDNGNTLLEPEPIDQDRGWHFWAIIAGLSVTGLLSAVEATVVSTSLPTIVHDLDIRNNYAWTVNAYFLTWYRLLPSQTLAKEADMIKHGGPTPLRPTLRYFWKAMAYDNSRLPPHTWKCY